MVVPEVRSLWDESQRYKKWVLNSLWVLCLALNSVINGSKLAKGVLVIYLVLLSVNYLLFFLNCIISKIFVTGFVVKVVRFAEAFAELCWFYLPCGGIAIALLTAIGLNPASPDPGLVFIVGVLIGGSLFMFVLVLVIKTTVVGSDNRTIFGTAWGLFWSVVGAVGTWAAPTAAVYWINLSFTVIGRVVLILAMIVIMRAIGRIASRILRQQQRQNIGYSLTPHSDTSSAADTDYELADHTPELIGNM